LRLSIILVGLVCLAALLANIGGSFGVATNVNQLLTSTTTIGVTVSTSNSQSQQIFNGGFTVPATTGTNLACEYWALNFTAATGQYVYGNFTAYNPIGFFVVQQSTYQTWVNSGTCGNAADSISTQLITTSYHFNATIPSSGVWVIVFVNSSNAKNADGELLANLAPVMGATTFTQPVVLTTTISSTISSPTVTGQAPSVAGFPLLSIILGVVVGLIGTMVMRRRKLR